MLRFARNNENSRIPSKNLEFLANSKTRGSGSKKLGSKILERFLVLKPLR
ncbi:MAG: hypothetical protein SO045_02195 [Campylobacter sp.]|nr:hypothetical protein [Campylobacter sp.]